MFYVLNPIPGGHLHGHRSRLPPVTPSPDLPQLARDVRHQASPGVNKIKLFLAVICEVS
jgi:hypothetical protein